MVHLLNSLNLSSVESDVTSYERGSVTHNHCQISELGRLSLGKKHSNFQKFFKAELRLYRKRKDKARSPRFFVFHPFNPRCSSWCFVLPRQGMKNLRPTWPPWRPSWKAWGLPHCANWSFILVRCSRAQEFQSFEPIHVRFISLSCHFHSWEPTGTPSEKKRKNKALIKPYSGKPMVNSPLRHLKALFQGGWHWGVFLGSHEHWAVWSIHAFDMQSLMDLVHAHASSSTLGGIAQFGSTENGGNS